MRDIRGAEFRLGAYYFAYFTYAGVLAPYFTLWLVAQGHGAADIALIMAMPQAARVFAPAAWGWIADRSGWRKGIVVLASLAVLLGFASLYAVRGVAATAAVMLLLSILSSGSMPIVESATMRATEGRAGRYGLVRLWGSVGFILAVLGAGWWLDRGSPSSILDMVVALAFAVVIVSLGVPADGARRAGGPGGGLGALLARKDVQAFFAACMCNAVSHGALYTFFSLHAEGAGYSKTAIGVLWTLGVVAEIGVFLALPALLRRFTLQQILVFSFACVTVRFLLIAWATDAVALLTVAQLLHAATFGAFHAASIAAVHKLFSGAVEARGQAVYASLTGGAGGAAGTLIAGWTWASLGPEACFTVAAAFGALGGVLIAWRVRV